MKIKESNFAYVYLRLLSFICTDIARWLCPRPCWRLRPGRRRDRTADREAPLHPLDLVRRNAHGEAKRALFVASAHDLGVLIEPMQPLPVARVERQFEFRTSASQATLDRGQKVIDPLPRRRGNGKRRSLRGLLLLSERGPRVRVKQVHLVPRLD